MKPFPRGSRIWAVAGPQASHSPFTLSITTPSPLSQPYLIDLPLHLTLSTRAFLTKCYCRLSLNRPFLFSYFPILCLHFPVHPAGFSFCNFTGFLASFNVVTSQQQQKAPVVICSSMDEKFIWATSCINIMELIKLIAITCSQKRSRNIWRYPRLSSVSSNKNDNTIPRISDKNDDTKINPRHMLEANHFLLQFAL